MTRRRKQAAVYALLAVGVLDLLVGVVLRIAGHQERLLFVGGLSFVIAALLLAFVWDVRPGGQIGGRPS